GEGRGADRRQLEGGARFGPEEALGGLGAGSQAIEMRDVEPAQAGDVHPVSERHRRGNEVFRMLAELQGPQDVGSRRAGFLIGMSRPFGVPPVGGPGFPLNNRRSHEENTKNKEPGIYPLRESLAPRAAGLSPAGLNPAAG